MRLEHVRGHIDAGNQSAELLAIDGASEVLPPPRNWETLYSSVVQQIGQVQASRRLDGVSVFHEISIGASSADHDDLEEYESD